MSKKSYSKNAATKQSKFQCDDNSDTDDVSVIAEGYKDLKGAKLPQAYKGGKAQSKQYKKAMSSPEESETEASDSDADSEDDDGAEEVQVPESFKRAVINFVVVDDKSRKLKEMQKELNLEKKKLEAKIIENMEKLQTFTIDITGGKLHRNKSETQAPLKQDLIFKTLKEGVGKNKAKELFEKMMESRPKTTRINLKRIRDKQKA
jgi:hypothetical protein